MLGAPKSVQRFHRVHGKDRTAHRAAIFALHRPELALMLQSHARSFLSLSRGSSCLVALDELM